MSRPVTRRMARLASAASVAASVPTAAASVAVPGSVASPVAASRAAPSGPSKAATAAAKRAAMLAEFKALSMSPTVTGPQLDAFMVGKPQSLWSYEKHWLRAVHGWIDRAQWGPLFWYLMIWKNADGIMGMPFLEDVLNKMRSSKSGALFRRSAFWAEMRAFLMEHPTTPWWRRHVHASILEDEAYVALLLKSDWPGVARVFVDALKELKNRPTTGEIYVDAAKHIYRNHLSSLMFDFPENASTAFSLVASDYNPHQRAYLLAIIQERPTSPPLVATPGAYARLIVFLYSFLKACEREDEKEQVQPILDAFVAKFDFKRTENKVFLNHMFIVSIAGQTLSAAKKQQIFTIIEFFVRRYQINVNNIYVDMDNAELHRFQPLVDLVHQSTILRGDPIVNPGRWMNHNLPLVALAIMYGNKKALLTLMSMGATLKRCAFTLADLTTDPQIHKLLLADAKATKIQRAYQRHMYAPEHSTQVARQSKWDRGIA